jgi:hypothetical protein
MSDVNAIKPSCPSCTKITPVRRNFQAESHTVFDSSPKTLGGLADRNTDRKSSDEIEHTRRENTKYLDQPFTGKLPDGMKTYDRDSSGRRIPDKKQRRVDPRRKS